jgi:FkbM family methyltransferase
MLAPPTPDTLPSYLKQLFDTPAAALDPQPSLDEGVILYGSGQLGVMAAHFLKQVGVPIHSVIDRAAQAGSQFMDEIPLIPLEDAIPSEGIPLVITTVSTPFTPLADSLHQLGWKQIQHFYDFAQYFKDSHPLNNGWYSGELTPTDQSGIEVLCNQFADQYSQAAYLQFLAWRCLRQDWQFSHAPITIDDRFFIEPVRKVLNQHERFIDVGAYDGRVFLKFLNHTQSHYDAALLIEADDESYQTLSKTVEALPSIDVTKITLSKIAITDRDGVQPFCHGYGFMSRLGTTWAEKTVVTSTLDNIAPCCSLIKIHIEGGELNALEGAIHTLHRERPILMVTVYHNRAGLWELPLWLMAHLKNYTFYFRLHNWCGTGAVLYAIPNERQSTF